MQLIGNIASNEIAIGLFVEPTVAQCLVEQVCLLRISCTQAIPLSNFSLKEKSKIRNGTNFLTITAFSIPFQDQILYFILGSNQTKLIDISGKLLTYPSPKPILTLNSH